MVEHGGFLYDSDSYGDDLPFWTVVRTADGRNVPHLVVPYTLDANDMRFATPAGFATADDFFAYLRDAFDVLYAEGDEAPKMMSVGMHCRLLGRPGRFRALQRFLDHVEAHDRVWVARRVDIARHWADAPSFRRAGHPDDGDATPTLAALSAAPKDEFVRVLGGIFEHTSWIAERAYERRPFENVDALHARCSPRLPPRRARRSSH